MGNPCSMTDMVESDYTYDFSAFCPVCDNPQLTMNSSHDSYDNSKHFRVTCSLCKWSSYTMSTSAVDPVKLAKFFEREASNFKAHCFVQRLKR